MGAWKRCSKCKGKVDVFTVIGKTSRSSGSTDMNREGRKCRDIKCQHLEVVSMNNTPKKSD